LTTTATITTANTTTTTTATVSASYCIIFAVFSVCEMDKEGHEAV
jgi:hypothetical protein